MDSTKQLEEFCDFYLPQYFAYKYKRQFREKRGRQHFDYRNEGNVYELTFRIFSFVDQLMLTNVNLKPSQIIETYFLFTIGDFQQNSQVKDSQEDTQEPLKNVVCQVLKKMKDYHRKYFILLFYVLYLYFDSKQVEEKNDLKKEQKIQKRRNNKNTLIVYYQDLKLFYLLGGTSIVPSLFMEYVLMKLLDMNPSQEFLKRIKELLVELDFPEISHDKITEKIKSIINNNQKKAKKSLKNFLQQQQKLEIKQAQKSQSENLTKNQSNEGTPIKERSIEKTQQHTLETTDKKQHMIIKNQEKIAIHQDCMKKTLHFYDKFKKKSKQRTIYMRSKFLAPKTILANMSKKPSISQQIQKINQIKEAKLDQLSRSFSSRYLKIQDDNGDDQGFIGGATPKPKKKIKIEHASGTQKIF